jgi:NDP-sugar pyrophosphorylase family protein
MKSIQLDQSQIAMLIAQGCASHNWKTVIFSPTTDISRFRNVTFIGEVNIGDNRGTILADGVERECGIYNAVIAQCTIGDNVRIANIGSEISNYTIEENVVIEHVASITSELNALCGKGVEVDVINEAGGRGTILFNELNSQTAYLQALLKYNSTFTTKLTTLVNKKNADTSTHASVCAHARIVHSGAIKNVTIGAYANIHGTQFLENGTILSCKEHPTEVGEAVQARSFIIAEGAKIDSGAILDKVFVGQAVKMGKQFSAENSMFFANCEGFHGEAVSLFAGPYTVTHHKSTLLIAGLFSFFNAGSGTNQSNHMYKLGPVHQGIFERGCKTGSFSYVLLESHIGAFSVVIGKHYTNINTPNLPFSYLHEEEGTSKCIPGMNLFSVGTARDGEKWPKRDNRKAPLKRDMIIFDVFSPYTIEKMRRGRDELLSLSESTPKEKAFVIYGGVEINRLLLKKGAKYYSMAIARYLNDKVCERITEALKSSDDWTNALSSLKAVSQLKVSNEWTDISGLITPRERLAVLEEKIISGIIKSVDEITNEFQQMFNTYRADEWQYIYETYKREYDIDLASITKDQARTAIDAWQSSATSLHSMILEDSKREFGSFAKIGYGLDRIIEETEQDFIAVRGISETNSVVQKLVKEVNEIKQRYEQFKNLIQ